MEAVAVAVDAWLADGNIIHARQRLLVRNSLNGVSDLLNGLNERELVRNHRRQLCS
jgi:hypothetical protein